jgi:hypothetical protein
MCDLCTALQEIREELRELRLLLRPKKCSTADMEVLSRVLPAVAGRWGSSPITAREILTDPAIQALFPGSPGSLGSMLSRAEADRAVAYGYCVQKASLEHGAVVWIVLKLPASLDTSMD